MSLLPTAPPPTTADIENLQAEIDSNSEHMSLLGAFYLNDALSSPSSTLNTLTQALGNVSHTFSQATLMRLQPCVIKKIYISMNGPGEFTSGSARWRLWRNAVRTGTEAFDTGNKSNASFTYALDNQLSQWYDVDIAMTSESDYLTAQFVASSLTGGPEGIYMQLWGSRT
jgi:hypothetical protein